MIENNQFSLASNITHKSLFSPEAVKKINEMASQLKCFNESSRCLPNCEVEDPILRAPNSTVTNLAEDNLQYCLYTHLSICPTLYCPKTEWICEKNHFGSVKNIYKQFQVSSTLWWLITMVILFTFLMTGQIELLYIGLASLLVLMLSIIMSFRKIIWKLY